MKGFWCGLPVLLLPLITGCGGDDDPVAPIRSGEISLVMSGIGPSDIESGVIERNVDITSAAVNLWTSYVRLTTDLCGNAPAGFGINTLEVRLDLEESVGVTALDEVFDGTVTVYFGAGGTTVDVGSGVLTGQGPVGLAASATREALAVLHDGMLESDFRVGLRGGTSRTRNDSFSMHLSVTFHAQAFCG